MKILVKTVEDITGRTGKKYTKINNLYSIFDSDIAKDFHKHIDEMCEVAVDEKDNWKNIRQMPKWIEGQGLATADEGSEEPIKVSEKVSVVSDEGTPFGVQTKGVHANPYKAAYPKDPVGLGIELWIAMNPYFAKQEIDPIEGMKLCCSLVKQAQKEFE